MKENFKKIPRLPLSALIFYLSILILWKFGFIPSPSNILVFLENLYTSYGLTGLFIASFLEGIVYLGLYFPGSFIVALAVILSDGSFTSLLLISLIVASALTITALINYSFGKKIGINKQKNQLPPKENRVLSNGLLISMLHPNSLAFYFFNSGIKKQNFLKILFVPLVMIPYGLAVGYLLYSIKGAVKKAVESPYLMITIILIWILLAFVIEIRKTYQNNNHTKEYGKDF
ncbi:MAG: hypothetical protein WAV31_04765 [Candidatus Moraniibacteriota bacterium]